MKTKKYIRKEERIYWKKSKEEFKEEKKGYNEENHKNKKGKEDELCTYCKPNLGFVDVIITVCQWDIPACEWG